MSEEANQHPNPDETDDGYPVAVPEPLMLRPELPPTMQSAEPEPHDSDKDRLRFSLGELLVVTTCFAIYLSLLSYLPGGHTLEGFAGTTGLLILVGLILMTFCRPLRPLFPLCWWTLLITYVVACMLCVARGR